MKNLVISLSLALMAGCSSAPTSGDEQPTEGTNGAALSYPQTRRDPVQDELHGTTVSDPYRWLEDVESTEVQTWMDAQDSFTRAYLDDLDHRSRLEERFAELYYVDSVSAPSRRGSRYFYSRRHADKEKRVYYWKEGEEGEEQVLLDPNTLSEDGSTSVGFVKPSWDGELAAYTLKENNADESTLYVMDVATGETSETDVIPGAKYAWPSWKPDSTGFYYTKLPVDESIPTADRPGYAHIRYHEIGTDPAADPVIREKTGDPTIFVGADVSYDGRYLFYYKYKGWTATDVYVKDLESPEDEWVTLVEGEPFQYEVIAWEDTFYIFTNQDAPRWKLMATPAMKTDRNAWETRIPQPDQGSVISDVRLVGGLFAARYLTDVKGDLRLWGQDGTLVRDMELPGVGAVSGVTGHPEDDSVYYSFQSFTVPPSIYETSVSTGKTDLFFTVDVPVDPSPYKVEQVFFESKDGTKVPMFVVTRKEIELDGSTPLLLYGYGGFNVTLQPYFRSSIYPWLEAGGAYAVPNLRGGGEYGEDWHKAGMLGQKQNVFDDFIAAAEYLVDEGYTSPDRLAIYGGSNGGLLVGAVMTQRPELFRAVVCSVPLLDMVRFHLFGSGKTWVTEYGDPENPDDFGYLHAYSPYHRVEEGTEYPALLMLSADSDDRVDPMHARKFTAAVQHATTSDHPVLLRIERNAGHGGADLIKQYVAKDADLYTFLMKELGVVGDGPGDESTPKGQERGDSE